MLLMSDVEECGLEGGDFVEVCGRQSVSVRVFEVYGSQVVFCELGLRIAFSETEEVRLET
jgi:hypothetical protein